MTAHNQQLFTRCPHCRTIFRMAVQVEETEQSWVKCGRCKKVFDSEKNKVDPKAFLKTEETTDSTDLKTKSQSQTKKTKLSTLSNIESSDASSAETESGSSTEKTKASTLTSQKKTGSADLKTKTENEALKSHAENQTSSSISLSQSSTSENIFQDDSAKEEEQLSFIKGKEDKNIEKPKDEGMKPAEVDARPSTRKIDPVEAGNNGNLKRSKMQINRPVPEKPALTIKSTTPSLRPSKEKTLAEQQKINAKAQKKRQAEKTQWTKAILAQAQSWKGEKNRFQARRSYTGLLAILGLLALLIWQVAIVNYSKLANYSFLSGPLSLTCAVFSCNKEKPASEHQFEILHANLRRHPTSPGVMTISANLINYSNSDKLLPSIRLDLTDSNELVVASRTINLVEHPQYIDPAISLLSPGQDVKLKLDIDRPVGSAVGFELSVIN